MKQVSNFKCQKAAGQVTRKIVAFHVLPKRQVYKLETSKPGLDVPLLPVAKRHLLEEA
jgi:hypothetical protein